jgi:hypothetical protein
MEGLPGYKQYNVVLDIDETFVHFIGKHEWDSLPESEKRKYKTSGENERQFFVYRPHVEEFFTFLFDTMKSVSLWTLSDIDYARSVKNIIERNWSGGRKLLQVLADTENETASNEYGGNKNLHWLVDEYGDPFARNNTILIDDHYPNTQHKDNQLNGIKIKTFAPFGLTKYDASVRKADPTKLRNSKYVDMSKDDTLLKVIDKLKEVMKKQPSGDSVFTKPVAINTTLTEEDTEEETLKSCVKKAVQQLTECTEGKSNKNIGAGESGGRRTRRKKRKTMKRKHSRRH